MRCKGSVWRCLGSVSSGSESAVFARDQSCGICDRIVQATLGFPSPCLPLWDLGLCLPGLHLLRRDDVAAGNRNQRPVRPDLIVLLGYAPKKRQPSMVGICVFWDGDTDLYAQHI